MVGGLTSLVPNDLRRMRMDNKKNKIPQGGTTRGGESPPPSSTSEGGRSKDSGGCTIVRCDSEKAIKHAPASPTKTLKKTGKWGSLGELALNPFARSSPLKRTPPKGATILTSTSPGDCLEDDVFVPSSHEKGRKKEREGATFSLFQETMCQILEAIKDLDKEISKSSNTKREIKVTADLLRHLGAKLEREDVSFFFGEVASLRDQVAGAIPRQEPSAKASTTISTQTCAWHREGETATVGSLAGIRSLREFQAVADLEWEEPVFTNVLVKTGNPLETPHSTVKCVLIEPQDRSMNHSIQRHYRDRFPELAPLEEEYAVLEQRTRRKGPGGESETLQKIVKIHHNGSEEDLWTKLQALRDETRGEEALAIHHVEALPVERLRKLTQAVFRGVIVRVDIFTTPQRKDRERVSTPRKKETKEKATLALEVDVGQKHTFKDILKGVREAVSHQPGSECIQALRSTREGKLLIVMDKNEDALARVAKLLDGRNIGGRPVGHRERMETVHLRGLDGLATREEVLSALEEAVGADDGTRVGQLRPNSQNTQAVTVTMAKRLADQLLETGHLRVGPSRCQAIKRLEVRKCSRCWNFDHTSSCCKGPDRTRNCRNCGQPGHLAKDCKGVRSCVLCKEDHVIGSGLCKAFKSALNRARRQEERRRHPSQAVEGMEMKDSERQRKRSPPLRRAPKPRAWPHPL